MKKKKIGVLAEGWKLIPPITLFTFYAQLKQSLHRYVIYYLPLKTKKKKIFSFFFCVYSQTYRDSNMFSFSSPILQN